MGIEPRLTISLSIKSQAPFVHHSSSLCFIGETLYCAWFSGPFEGSRDTSIFLSSRENNVWSPPQRVADAGAEPHWNPVLHHFGGKLWLFFKVGIYPKRWRTLVTQRDADGSWGAISELVPGDSGGRGPVKNKILVLANGDWLAPASLERDSGWACFVDRSTDNGQRWTAQALIRPNHCPPGRAGIIQPSLWESSPGQIHLLARSDLGYIYRADSQDHGQTWSSAYPIDLPNNNSGLDLIQLDGCLLLACNPISNPHGPRSPLTLFRSTNNGETWRELFVLEDAPGEFSYPAIIPSQHGFVVSYTENRGAIKVREFTLSH